MKKKNAVSHVCSLLPGSFLAYNFLTIQRFLKSEKQKAFGVAHWIHCKSSVNNRVFIAKCYISLSSDRSALPSLFSGSLHCFSLLNVSSALLIFVFVYLA